MNNEELLKENAKLNAIIDGYQPKMQALKDERDKYYQQTLDDEITLNELYQTLQEIKAIAEIKIECKQYEIDYDCFNDTRCKALKELIQTLQEILDLITKAGSEGENEVK